MLKQLNNYLNTNKLVPTYISGYRQDYSIETTLPKLCLDILNGMEHQEITCLIAMDVSAAFGTVHHNILLNVLSSHYNISNTALKWITSYLSDRQTYISVHNLDSDGHIMDFSVPQGSILGPVLFNLYASTLESHLRLNNSNTPVISYADDHSTYKQFLAHNRQAELRQHKNARRHITTCTTVDESKLFKIKHRQNRIHLFWSLQAVKKVHSTKINVCEDIVNRKKINMLPKAENGQESLIQKLYIQHYDG